MIVLHTRRLLLREFSEEDAAFFYQLNADKEVTQFTGDTAFSSVDESLELIRAYDQYEKYNRGRLTVILKESGAHIGWCGLKYHPETDETDLGYRFMKQYWNKGYATESSQVCIAYAFDELKLPFIIAKASKDNIASIRVMKKLGFRFCEEFMEHDSLCVKYRLDRF